MTDKQIIIDGCDVSGCKYFANNKCLMLCATGTACDVYPYCYYKAYKAKEQECEAYKMEAEEGKEINAELKAENEKLEEQLELNTANAVVIDMAQRLYKLKQTLTEIKEIVEHCINQDICTFCDYSDRCYIEDEEIPTYDVCKLILQKISECEGE